MIYYPIEWCEKAGISSILVLTLSEHHNAIQSYVRSHRTSKLYIQAESCSSFKDNIGTADVLRVAHQKGWITSDFVVVPCDLVTNLNGTVLAKLWMTEQAAFDGDLGRRARKRGAGDGKDGRRGGLMVAYNTKGEGEVKGQETDFLVTSSPRDDETGTLLDLYPNEKIKELVEFPISYKMVEKCPDLTIFDTYRDAGIYFLPHWVLKFIARNPRMSSLHKHILPYLARSRWESRKLAAKLGLTEILTGADDNLEDDESEENPSEEHDVGSMSTMRKRRSSNPAKDELVEIPPITTYMPTKAPSMFMRRVDTTQSYLFTSLYLAKSDPKEQSSTIKIDPSATIGEKANVTGIDCLVAEKVTIGAKAIVKKSVIGAGCTIGNGVRLMGCVLMDGAKVGDNAKLEGCVIGREAVVGAKCALKDCEVAEGFDVDADTEARGEKFVPFDAMGGVSDEDDEDDDEEEYSEEEDDDEEDEDDDDEEEDDE
ncbi:hypothetical protein BZA77DRAFT_238887 [Pyronema omphalodes]|nr:hypothetical protein BZA77DRAFT_238887 [Pyronema omphalodes]